MNSGSEQKRVRPSAKGNGKGEMGKVREKGLRRGKTAFCRGATHRKREKLRLSSATRE